MEIKTVRIIGVGGIGSWLACSLSRKYDIAIYDNDNIEESNLKRSFLPTILGIKKVDGLSLLLNNLYSHRVYVYRVSYDPTNFKATHDEILIDSTDSSLFESIEDERLIKVKAVNGYEYIITNLSTASKWEVDDENIRENNINSYRISNYLPILGVMTLRVLEEFEEKEPFYFRLYVNIKDFKIDYEVIDKDDNQEVENAVE